MTNDQGNDRSSRTEIQAKMNGSKNYQPRNNQTAPWEDQHVGRDYPRPEGFQKGATYGNAYNSGTWSTGPATIVPESQEWLCCHCNRWNYDDSYLMNGTSNMQLGARTVHGQEEPYMAHDNQTQSQFDQNYRQQHISAETYRPAHNFDHNHYTHHYY